MINENFQLSITATVSAQESFKKINQVDKWWAKKVKGKSGQLNDKFTVDFGSTWVDFQISELVPNKKITWHVIDCNLQWIDDKKEWNGNDVAFEITEKNGTTQIDFTHIGLVPTAECYEDCKVGWTGHVTESLVQFLNTGTGMPE